MTSVIDSIRDMFADKANLIDTGDGTLIVQPADGAEGPVAAGKTHVLSHLHYVDKAGHTHGVLIDTVTTHSDGVTPFGGSTTIEILADVVITPPPG
jgi:hypothetical protein